MKNINILFIQYIKDNLFRIILLLIFFILGIVCSMIYCNLLDEETKSSLINYMQIFNNNILSGEYKLSYLNIIINTIKQSTIYTLIIIILGCTVVFSKLIYITFFYRGFLVGFCLSIAIMLLGNIKGTIYGIVFLFLSNIFFLFFEIIISIIWFKFSNSVLKDKNLYNIKKQIYQKTIISAITLSIMIIILIPIQLLINMNIYSFLKIL